MDSNAACISVMQRNAIKDQNANSLNHPRGEIVSPDPCFFLQLQNQLQNQGAFDSYLLRKSSQAM